MQSKAILLLRQTIALLLQILKKKKTIVWKGSPNYWRGRNGYKPIGIVIHIMEGSLLGTSAWFNDPSSQVSAHYGIGKDGIVHQYVKDEDTAWHTGHSNATWKHANHGVNPNLFTIGIEHEGYARDAWTPEMLEASRNLIAKLCEKWDIPKDREHIIGHYELSDQRPNCPAVDKSIIEKLI